MYSLLWKAARPFLRRHKRLREGFEQRLVPRSWPYAPYLQVEQQQAWQEQTDPIGTRDILPTGADQATCASALNPAGLLAVPLEATDAAPGYFDLWIQAASGGESYLSWSLLRELAQNCPGLRVLCTTCTLQGLEILRKAQAAPENAALSITLNYLPLDEPALMKRAVAKVFGPRVPLIQKACKTSGSKERKEHKERAVNVQAADITDKVAKSIAGKANSRVMVLLETEIWPGLLAACQNAGVRVLILNARMTKSSYRAYRLIAPFLRLMVPQVILATGKDDLQRFCKILDNAPPPEQTNMEQAEQAHAEQTETLPVNRDLCRSLMPNIKFDRLAEQIDAEPLSAEQMDYASVEPDVMAKPDAPVLVLGSVREEEEVDLVLAVGAILRKAPQAALVIAPRHMHRVRAWQKQLTAAGLNFCLRSALAVTADHQQAEAQDPAARDTVAQTKSGQDTDGLDGFARIKFLPGHIYLWDVFGELGKLYSRANAVFVGGSLAPLGGQNFLEPLAYGLVPCIGPSWSNFAWVGQELFDFGLARQVQNAEELVPALLELLTAPRSRDEVLNDFRRYLKPRQGGTCQAVKLIKSYL